MPSRPPPPSAPVRASATEADEDHLARLIRERRSALPLDDRVRPACESRANHTTLAPEQLAERERRLQIRESEDRDRDRRLLVQRQAQILHTCAGERYVDCRLRNFTVTTPYQKRVVQTIREYCKTIAQRCQVGQGLVLYGPVGTGKDHLAYAVALSAVAAELTIGWLSGQEWFGQLRDAIEDGTSEQSLMGRIARPNLVVISDPLPPGGQLTQHQSSMLFRAIDGRYAQGRATVVTVNLADDAEADLRLGAATWDRICHGAWKVFCNWPSYRRPAREIRS
jgi:DNA replication protein DnaC